MLHIFAHIGGLIAQTWASMMVFGESGYMKVADDLMKETKVISVGIKKIRGMSLKV